MIDKPKQKTRVVLYARFSPRPGAALCESCDSQLKELREYAWKRGYEIIGEFRDDALSGGDSWDSRPGMFEAAAAVKRGYIFIVRAFDRLFRDTEKALVFKSMLEAKGVKIRSITEEVACDGSPVANLVRTIFLAVAEYQREIIRARTRMKMREYQKNGRRMSGDPPYGKLIDPSNPSRLINNPAEAPAIDAIKQLHLAGESMRAIARQLNKKGLARRGGKPWNHTLVRRILIREGMIEA